MTRKFKITVAGKTYEVEVDEIPIIQPETTPPPYIGPPKIQTAPPQRTVTSRPVIQQTRPTIAPKPQFTRSVASPAASSTQKVSTEVIVTDPLPGVVLSIKVKEGDQVKQGDTLMVLESMKMENAITSPSDGIVKQILVAVRASVQQGDQLIVIE